MNTAGMGLLNDPRMAGILGAAGGLLSAAGPTPYKVGFGGAMGAGMGGALSGMMGAQQFQADQKMRDQMSQYMDVLMGKMPGGGPLAGPAAGPQPPGGVVASAGDLGAPRMPASMPIAPMGMPAMGGQPPAMGAPAPLAGALPSSNDVAALAMRPMPRPFGRQPASMPFAPLGMGR